MKRVAILALEGTGAMSIYGPLDILMRLDKIERQKNPEGQGLFEVEIVSYQDKVIKALFGYPIYCDKTIEQVETVDLVIIPSLDENIVETLKQNEGLVAWLRKQFEGGADLASICTGAFLLAETGLLKGKRATTHWVSIPLFQSMFPDISVANDRVIVDEGGLISSGGAMSFMSLMLYLIEKYHGHEIAVLASKYMLIEFDRAPQNNYAIFSPQRNHQDREILKVQDFIETNFAKKVQVKDLASQAALSKRSFMRRFKKATGNTPNEYLQRVRVEAAKKSLETHDEPINSVIYDVGYNDIGTFRKVFKKYTGISPQHYKKKYGRLIGLA